MNGSDKSLVLILFTSILKAIFLVMLLKRQPEMCFPGDAAVTSVLLVNCSVGCLSAKCVGERDIKIPHTNMYK